MIYLKEFIGWGFAFKLDSSKNCTPESFFFERAYLRESKICVHLQSDEKEMLIYTVTHAYIQRVKTWCCSLFELIVLSSASSRERATPLRKSSMNRFHGAYLWERGRNFLYRDTSSGEFPSHQWPTFANKFSKARTLLICPTCQRELQNATDRTLNLQLWSQRVPGVIKYINTNPCIHRRIVLQ